MNNLESMQKEFSEEVGRREGFSIEFPWTSSVGGRMNGPCHWASWRCILPRSSEA